MLFIAATMSAQTQTDAYTAEVKKLLELSNTKEVVISTVATMWENMGLPLTDSNAASQAVFNEIWPDFVTASTTVYKKYFTLEEIQQVVAFQSTPVGKKFAEKSLYISNDIQSIFGSKDIVEKMTPIIQRYIKQ